MKESIT